MKRISLILPFLFAACALAAPVPAVAEDATTPLTSTCTLCHGSGYVTIVKPCTMCSGTGLLNGSTCTACHGLGYLVECVTCPTCGGTGTITTDSNTTDVVTAVNDTKGAVDAVNSSVTSANGKLDGLSSDLSDNKTAILAAVSDSSDSVSSYMPVLMSGLGAVGGVLLGTLCARFLWGR